MKQVKTCVKMVKQANFFLHIYVEISKSTNIHIMQIIIQDVTWWLHNVM